MNRGRRSSAKPGEVAPAEERRKLYSLWLDPDLKAALAAVKARDGVPESEQIRRALRVWFEQKGVMKPKRKA